MRHQDTTHQKIWPPSMLQAHTVENNDRHKYSHTQKKKKRPAHKLSHTQIKKRKMASKKRHQLWLKFGKLGLISLLLFAKRRNSVEDGFKQIEGGRGEGGGAKPPPKKQNTHPLSNFCFYMLWCKWTCKQQETMPGTQLNWLFDSLLPASILSHCVQVKKEKRKKKKPQTNQCRGLARACTWLIDLHTWIRPGARGGDSRQSPPLIWTSRD